MALNFSNGVFEPGINLTVRAGSKWAGMQGEVEVTAAGQGTVGKATIIGTVTMRWSEVTTADLDREHDPACRTKAGLLKVLKEVYGSFDENGEVTLVFFRF